MDCTLKSLQGVCQRHFCRLRQVCNEADRFRMSPVNGDATVESFKHLDLDYLEARHCMMHDEVLMPKIHGMS